MIVYEEKSFDDLYDLEGICWSGAIDRIKEVMDLDDEKQEKFVDYVKESLISEEEILTTTQLNDFIWFECDSFIEKLKGEED